MEWLVKNYAAELHSYDFKLKSKDYNSNRDNSSSPVLMAARSSKQTANGQQNRKMFNNFLDSLDVSNSAQVNVLGHNSGTGYQ